MPRIKVEREVPGTNDGNFATIEREVTQREETKLAQYRKPLSFAALQKMLSEASDAPGFDYKQWFPLTEREASDTESAQEFFLNLFVGAQDKWAAGDVYESLQSESTTITINKEKLDLMSVPLEVQIEGYNDTMSLVKSRMKLAKGTDAERREAVEKNIGSIPAWRSVAKRLTQGYDKDGKKYPAVARMDGETLVAL